jgi:hypothetical protein
MNLVHTFKNRSDLSEHGLWTCHTTVEKYDHIPSDIGLEIAEWDRQVLAGLIEPYAVEEVEGNLLVTAGLNAMLTLLIGGGGTAFNNASAYLGVGDSVTAAAIGQTDLQAASNKTRVGMVATYPTTPASGATSFRSDHTASNYAWQEWGIFNASSAGTMLNRKVESLGTKASGTWTLTATITIT